MSNISGLQGSRESSPLKVVSPNLGEVRAASPELGKVGTSFQEVVQAGWSTSPDAPIPFPHSPSSTILTMTIEQVEKLRKQYCFPNEICTIVPYLEDRVTSGLHGCVALYEEYFRAGLRFSFHPFIRCIFRSLF